MALHEWEAIIQKIIDESKQQPTDSRMDRLLTVWRAKLEKEPPQLQPHQIDTIVREVRRRLNATNG